MLADGYIMKIKCALWKGLRNHFSSEGSIPEKKKEEKKKGNEDE